MWSAESNDRTTVTALLKWSSAYHGTRGITAYIKPVALIDNFRDDKLNFQNRSENLLANVISCKRPCESKRRIINQPPKFGCLTGKK